MGIIYHGRIFELFASPFVHFSCVHFLFIILFLYYAGHYSEQLYGTKFYFIHHIMIYIFATAFRTGISFLFFRVTGWNYTNWYYYRPFRTCTCGLNGVLFGLLILDAQTRIHLKKFCRESQIVFSVSFILLVLMNYFLLHTFYDNISGFIVGFLCILFFFDDRQKMILNSQIDGELLQFLERKRLISCFYQVSKDALLVL